MPEFSARGVIRDTIGLIGPGFLPHLAYAFASVALSVGASQFANGQLLAQVQAGSLAPAAMFASPLYWFNMLVGVAAFGWGVTGISGSMLRAQDGPASIAEMARISATNIGKFLLLYLIWYLALVVGFMLLIVPGVIVLTMFAAAIPAMIDRKTGPWEALQESRSLTKGKRLRIFATLLVLGLVMLLSTVATLPGMSFDPSVALTNVPSSQAGSVAISLVAGTLSMMIMSAYMVALYRRLAGGGGVTPELREAFA